ncbi:hypothetical protein [Paraphotobacterium marinum]|nr:hypothetical protein [Paraphotobacterium marinum]
MLEQIRGSVWITDELITPLSSSVNFQIELGYLKLLIKRLKKAKINFFDI